MDNGTTGDTSTGYDMGAMSERIGSAVFGPESTGSTEAAVPDDATPVEAPAAPDLLEVPKSWPKEMHTHWGTTPRPVQEYWRTREKQMLDGLEQYKQDALYGKPLRETLTPYQSLLQQMRLTPPQAIDALMRAHTRLTTGSLEERRAAYQELGKNLQLVEAAAQPGTAPMDPALKQVQEQLSTLEQAMAARQQAEYADAKTKAEKEVEAFAADQKAHPYFDEVADDIAILLKTQPGLTLEQAYTKAVRANDVTWAKEVARIQSDHEAKLKETARLEALPKKRAAGINVRASDTAKTPTESEPVGRLEDTIREAHRQLKARPS